MIVPKKFVKNLFSITDFNKFTAKEIYWSGLRYDYSLDTVRTYLNELHQEQTLIKLNLPNETNVYRFKHADEIDVSTERFNMIKFYECLLKLGLAKDEWFGMNDLIQLDINKTTSYQLTNNNIIFYCNQLVEKGSLETRLVKRSRKYKLTFIKPKPDYVKHSQQYTNLMEFAQILGQLDFVQRDEQFNVDTLRKYPHFKRVPKNTLISRLNNLAVDRILSKKKSWFKWGADREKEIIVSTKTRIDTQEFLDNLKQFYQGKWFSIDDVNVDLYPEFKHFQIEHQIKTLLKRNELQRTKEVRTYFYNFL